MRLIASDLYSYYRPSRCALRVYLRHRGEPEAPPGPYEEIIRRLGLRHESAHLATFPTCVDLRGGTEEKRIRETRKQISAGAPVLYHPLLRAPMTLDGIECEVVGEPDFIVFQNGHYRIRDCKLSRAHRINQADHPEILEQLQLYGWLYEASLGEPPFCLEVLSGSGGSVEIPFSAGRPALASLSEIAALKRAASEPYSPVGWTKCGGCGFRDRCWSRAEAEKTVALVPGVDQGLASALHHEGIETVEALLASFNETTLADFTRPWGTGTQRVGKRAASIIRAARAMVSGKELLLQQPSLPGGSNYVMFDLEGLPPHLDELEKIYLWGLQVVGKRPSDYQAAVAGFGEDGDREGWESFLGLASDVFEIYGDIPFVHWHHYERVKLKLYVSRFGDRNGIAARVERNLLDLLPITQTSVALPLPSYSLKVVEHYVGFRRTQEEYGGDWAMAKYIEATEMEDDAKRQEVIDQIRRYNREDLEATWAVLRWLKEKAQCRASF